MIKTSDESKEIFGAIIKAQAEFPVALKDTPNDFTKKKYADFQSVVEAARPTLAKYGLGFMQMPIQSEAGIMLLTRIFHTSGQWIEGAMPIKTMKDDPQSLGAAITYAKRYALQAAFGIIASEEDSDAEKAMSRDNKDRLLSRQQVSGLMKGFQGIGVTESQVLKFIGAASTADLTESDSETLSEIGADIKAGRAKKESYFGGTK